MVTLTGSPFKGNELKAETGKVVHFWLLVAPQETHACCRTSCAGIIRDFTITLCRANSRRRQGAKTESNS